MGQYAPVNGLEAMKIFVTGTRGIPDIPGGVEKHCQELYPRIAAMGHEVYLATRLPYVDLPQNEWQGVRLVHTFCPRSKSLEAIVHTFVAILKARWIGSDVVHIHAVGPGLMVPLARLIGLRVVVTNHGPDYDRQKWGLAAKVMLRLGEYLGGKFAHAVIVISSVISDIIVKRCGRSTYLIHNGVPMPEPSRSCDQLQRFGIRSGGYILAVARFVPEKGLHDLIAAFTALDGECLQLVIAGDADHATAYSKKLRDLAAQDKRIVLTGYITGEALHQVFSHARLFVLPSYHEGLPIALLEAMSYGLPVLVSDIPANKEVGLDPSRYFRPGDVEGLRQKLAEMINQGISGDEQQYFRERIVTDYNWEKIAAQVVEVYEQVRNA
jgi:glycosyltransferase involved in cell wall biosynthesis